MFKIPFLRNILLVSVLFATVFPLYDLFFTLPSYQKLLIQETEQEAVRFVRFLVVSNYLDKFELSQGALPETLLNEIEQLKQEGKVIKLRVFSPLGEIVYSTDSQEIGTVNKKKYFREIVATGSLYSKIVRKESVTAEGNLTDRDIVETYVPVMIDDHFHAAMEVYFDISETSKSLNALSRESFLTFVTASVGLLLMTLLLLFRARINIEARDAAELALQTANEDLEERVGKRTAELSSANQLLAAEVSERKKAQLAQRDAFVAISEARDRINAIISSVADALLVTDHLDNVVLINPAAEKLFNIKTEDVLGRRLPDVVGFDELLLEITKARKDLKGAESIEFDFVMDYEDGKRIYQGRASRLLDAAFNERGLILLIHDVTRERQIDRMKSEFVSMAAHELQTPLTMVLGYSELLLDPSKEFAPEEQGEFLHIINEKSVELSSLIDDILDLSRIEDGRGLQLKFSQVDFGRLCSQLTAEFDGTNPKHSFIFSQVENSKRVNADEPRLVQVVENLIGNAVKYSPEGGPIRVELSRDENWARLQVVDQGIGMSEEEIENAFERFYRGDASNTAVRGTGLGLSITKYIVDAHGGTIEIFSQKGKGTRVEVRLPLID